MLNAVLIVVIAFGAQSQLPISPQPGRANGVTDATDSRQKDSRSSQAPTPQSPASTEPIQGTNPNEQRPAVARPNEQQPNNQTVVARRFPPVDLKRDWVDYAPIGLSVLLILVAGYQLFLLKGTVEATEKAANAARLSANTADESFKMAMTGYLGIKDAFVKIGGTNVDGDVAAIVVGYKLFNACNVPLRLSRFEARYDVSGSTEHEWTRTQGLDEMLPPTKGYTFPLIVDELSDAQRNALREGRLIVRIQLTATITDPLHRTTRHEFKRVMVCGPRETVRSQLWDGNPDSE